MTFSAFLSVCILLNTLSDEESTDTRFKVTTLEKRYEDSTPKDAVLGLLKRTLKDDSKVKLLPVLYKGLPIPRKGIRYASRVLSLDPHTYRMMVEIRATRREKLLAVKEFPIGWKVIEVASVPRHRIGRGVSLRKTDLINIEIEFGDELDRYETQEERLIGMIAKASLLPNQPIARWMLESPPVVHRGMPVLAQVIVGRMRVTMDGESLEDGVVGQSVKVLNPRSKQILHGRVKRRGVVEIYK